MQQVLGFRRMNNKKMRSNGGQTSAGFLNDTLFIITHTTIDRDPESNVLEFYWLNTPTSNHIRVQLCLFQWKMLKKLPVFFPRNMRHFKHGFQQVVLPHLSMPGSLGLDSTVQCSGVNSDQRLHPSINALFICLGKDTL
jgi:hypothetical protein